MRIIFDLVAWIRSVPTSIRKRWVEKELQKELNKARQDLEKTLENSPDERR
jgi:hypothetical protein